MSPEREVTIGELAEDVSDLASAIRELRTSLEDKYMQKEMYETKHSHLVELVKANNARHDAEIRELEARLTLIARTAVTALLAPILVIIVAAIMAGSFR